MIHYLPKVVRWVEALGSDTQLIDSGLMLIRLEEKGTAPGSLAQFILKSVNVASSLDLDSRNTNRIRD